MASLTAKYTDWAQWKNDLKWFDGQLATLQSGTPPESAEVQWFRGSVVNLPLTGRTQKFRPNRRIPMFG